MGEVVIHFLKFLSELVIDRGDDQVVLCPRWVIFVNNEIRFTQTNSYLRIFKYYFVIFIYPIFSVRWILLLTHKISISTLYLKVSYLSVL